MSISKMINDVDSSLPKKEKWIIAKKHFKLRKYFRRLLCDKTEMKYVQITGRMFFEQWLN